MLAPLRLSLPQRCAALLTLIGVLLASSETALSQDNADQLRVRALEQEGELILQEQKELQPMIAALEQGKEQLNVEEKSLQTETDAVRVGIEKHNLVVDEINEAVRKQQAECQSSEDAAVVDACNARAAALRGRSEAAAKDAAELSRRQKTLNERIARYNVAGTEWNKQSQESSVRLQPHQRDVDFWLSKVTEFLRSSSFAALAKKANSPEACEAEPLAQSAALAPSAAVERALECLRTLKDSMR